RYPIKENNISELSFSTQPFDESFSNPITRSNSPVSEGISTTDNEKYFEEKTIIETIQQLNQKEVSIEVTYAICKVLTNNKECNARLRASSSSTSNLISHLSSIHGITQDGSKYENVPSQTKIDLFVKTTYLYSKLKNNKLIMAFIKFVICNAQPISIIANQFFHEFIRELDLMFDLPNEKKVKQMIHTLYNQCAKEMQEKLQKTAITCSLTTDLWTACNRQGYLSVTCSWIDSDFKIHEILLSLTYVRYPYTADIIRKKLKNIIFDWGLMRKVYSITTDNSANMKAAINNMNRIVRIPCFAHTLQLVIEKGLMLAETFIAQAKRLINFFMVPKQNKRLEDAQKTLKVSDQNDAIDIVLTTLTISTAPDARKDAKRLKEIQLTDDEWNLMKDLVNILGPFCEVTEVLGGSEYISISYIVPSILKLMQKLIGPTSYSDEEPLRYSDEELNNEVNFETDDLAFDNDIGFTDAQEEEEKDPKKRKININTPTNTVNMRYRIKNALYNALLHYWDLSDNEVLLACLLDPRCKTLHFASPNQQQQAETALRTKYNDAKSIRQSSLSSNRSSSSNKD
ncbi:17814_t:CDS:2, partial [Cetraspora pellucida]